MFPFVSDTFFQSISSTWKCGWGMEKSNIVMHCTYCFRWIELHLKSLLLQIFNCDNHRDFFVVRTFTVMLRFKNGTAIRPILNDLHCFTTFVSFSLCRPTNDEIVLLAIYVCFSLLSTVQQFFTFAAIGDSGKQNKNRCSVHEQKYTFNSSDQRSQREKHKFSGEREKTQNKNTQANSNLAWKMRSKKNVKCTLFALQ